MRGRGPSPVEVVDRALRVLGLLPAHPFGLICLGGASVSPDLGQRIPNLAPADLLHPADVEILQSIRHLDAQAGLDGRPKPQDWLREIVSATAYPHCEVRIAQAIAVFEPDRDVDRFSDLADEVVRDARCRQECRRLLVWLQEEAEFHWADGERP